LIRKNNSRKECEMLKMLIR